MRHPRASFPDLQKLLRPMGLELQYFANKIRLTNATNQVEVYIKGEQELPAEAASGLILHEDHLRLSPEKVAALIQSKLGANQIIFARKCELRKVAKPVAEEFLNTYHLMNATQSAYNLGLYQKEELLALASFSKGRKMNRLQEHQRSFELIRFCCKSGITITGGLTRLVKTFCQEKSAGDVMTYVDRELSNGDSFLKAGFKIHSYTPPNFFLVNRVTLQREPSRQDAVYDAKRFYIDHNSGNIKFVFSPSEKPQ